jgi:hypothetical protein
MLIVPLTSVASQAVRISLGGQSCKVNVYEKSTGVYLDLLVNDSPIITGRLCLNDTKLVRDAYLGFVGDLAFLDTQGLSDPTSDGIGSRYVLMYLEASDL